MGTGREARLQLSIAVGEHGTQERGGVVAVVHRGGRAGQSIESEVAAVTHSPDSQ